MESLNLHPKDNDKINDESEPLEPTPETQQMMAQIESEIKEQKKQERVERAGLLSIIGSSLILFFGINQYSEHQKQKSLRYWDEKIQEKIESIQDSTEKTEVKKLTNKLKIKLGADLIYLFIYRKDTSLEKNKRLEISGFEQIGFQGEELRPVFDKTLYPDGMVDISGIVYDENYNVKTNIQAIPNATIDPEKRSIIILKSATSAFNKKGGNVGRFLEIVTHELAHLFDWETRLDLQPKDRLAFLNDVIETFEQKYFDDQRISLLIEESNELRYASKIKEYWAYLSELFLTDVDTFNKKTNEKEKQLIQKWLLRNKPYEAKVTQRNRFTLWQKIHKKIYNHLRSKNLDEDAGLEQRKP